MSTWATEDGVRLFVIKHYQTGSPKKFCEGEELEQNVRNQWQRLTLYALMAGKNHVQNLASHDQFYAHCPSFGRILQRS